jgi:hypothetical protein
MAMPNSFFEGHPKSITLNRINFFQELTETQ